MDEFVFESTNPVVVPEAQPIRETDEERQARADEEVGFVGGFLNEWGTVKVRMALASPSPFNFVDQYEPTPEERRELLELVDYDLDRYKSIVRGATSKEDMDSRAKIIKEVQEYRRQQSMASLADNLASGFGGIFGDPTSYVPMGAATITGRLTLAAGSSVFSSYANEYVSGDENDPVDTLTNTIMLGGTIEGLSRVRGKVAGAGRIVGDTGRRAAKTAKDIATNTVQDFKYLKGIRGTFGAINGMREKLESFAPAATVAGIAKKAGGNLGKLYRSMFKIEEGVRDEDGVFRQFDKSKSGFTAEEYKDLHFNDGYRYTNEVGDELVKLSKELNTSVEEINHLLRRRQEGYATSLDGNARFDNIFNRYQAFYGKRGDELQGNGLIDGNVTPELYMYEHRSFSGLKAADFLARQAGKTHAEKVTNGVKKLKALLLRTLEDPRYKKLLIAKFRKEVLDKKAKKAVRSKSTTIVTKEQAQKNRDGLSPNEEKEFLEWVEKEANDDALGMIDQNAGVQRHIYDDPENMDASYRHTRNPWKITIEDVDGFSIDRLLRDLYENMDSYNRRSSADLGVYKSMGFKSYKELDDAFSKALTEETRQSTASNVLKSKKEQRDAIRALLNAYYGRSGTDQEDIATWMNALSESLRNFTFFTKNVFMGFLNHFETTEAIKAYGASFMIKSIPGLESRLNDWSNGGLTKIERRDVINNIFGMESKMRGIWREIDTRNLERFQGNKWQARLVSGTEWLANNSPFTRYLNASNESITDCARGIFLGDLVRYAHSRSGSRKFFEEEVLQKLSISEEDFNSLLEGLRKGTRVRHDRIKFTDKFAKEIERNIGNLMNLRRLGDYVASEVILRPSLGDTFIWRGSKQSTFLNAAMQFKSFALRSYRKRLIKMANRIEEGDALGQALTMSIAGGLGLMSYVGQTALTASGMSEEQRRTYFKHTLGVEDLDDADGSTLANVFLNGSMRSSILAFPSLMANMSGVHVGIKSTSDQGIEGRDEAGQMNADEIMRTIFPAYNTVRGFWGVDSDIKNLINAGLLNPDEYMNSDRERYAKSFGRNLKAITPNIPLVQQGLINMITDNED